MGISGKSVKQSWEVSKLHDIFELIGFLSRCLGREPSARNPREQLALYTWVLSNCFSQRSQNISHHGNFEHTVGLLLPNLGVSQLSSCTPTPALSHRCDAADCYSVTRLLIALPHLPMDHQQQHHKPNSRTSGSTSGQ